MKNQVRENVLFLRAFKVVYISVGNIAVSASLSAINVTKAPITLLVTGSAMIDVEKPMVVRN